MGAEMVQKKGNPKIVRLCLRELCLIGRPHHPGAPVMSVGSMLTSFTVKQDKQVTRFTCLIALKANIVI
jgi:hypothetical protein